jgi:stage V sporulation protein AC
VTTASKSEQQKYKQTVSQYTPSRPILKNTIRAFLVGGTVCLIGQFIQSFYIQFAHFSQKDAGNPTVATLIFISVVLTAFGVYDKFASWAGAGSAVPVTGFANTMSSAAMEYRTEGWVAGVGGNMFRLAGSVVVYGVVSAFFVALIRYIIIRMI